jgi:endoglucanase
MRGMRASGQISRVVSTARARAASMSFPIRSQHRVPGRLRLKMSIVRLALGVVCVVAVGWQAAAAPARSGGVVHISGNRFIGIGGLALRLIGVNRSGTEYACAGPVAGGGFGYGVFQGPADDRSIRAMLRWDINAVALPLNEACWLGGYAGLNPKFTGARYRAAIVRYVERLNHFGIYVVLRLSGAAPGDHAYGSDPSSTDEIPMADSDHSVAFWASLAATFKPNRMVLFHTFDEPHHVGWECLLRGCTTTDAPNGTNRYGAYSTAGNQMIVDTIRAAGARQPIILSGPGFAGDLSGWKRYLPHDPARQLAADVSSFDYSDFVVSHQAELRRFARQHAVIVGGFGDTHCTSAYSRKLMGIMDSINQSYLAWTWNTVQDYGGCSNALLDDASAPINGQPAGYYTARPSGYGRGVRDHLQRLHTTAN